MKDFFESGKIYAFTIFILYVWALWLLKKRVSTKYRPFSGSSDFETSVIIPVVDEPTPVFMDVLRRIKKQSPSEFLVVINGKRNLKLESICKKENVNYIWTEVAGKRNALKVGIENTTKPVVVLVDSDTLWSPNTLEELVKPFNDPSVGGATTKQHILNPNRNIITKWASWLEEVRNRYSMPAMSVYGQVGCLPGRTIAFRRKVLESAIPDFMNEKFLGVKLEVSDDRSLTNYCLKQGYRAVMQSTSQVWTDAPTEWKILAKQQLRWARGSQYNTMRMAAWMFKNTKFLFFLYISDILIPFFLAGIVSAWGIKLATGSESEIYEVFGFAGGWAPAFIVVSIIVGTVLSFLSRQIWAIRTYRWSLLTFILINTFLLVPIRIIGFFGMAKNASWGTRSDSFSGDKAKSPQTLVPAFTGCSLLTLLTLLSLFLG